jgi:hypothetical protein
MGDEDQLPLYLCNGRGGIWCCTCKSAQRILKFFCAPFRAIYKIPWITWKDVLIMMSGVVLVLGLTAYEAYMSALNPSNGLPENLKFLLSGVVGYIFAYVPASKAITSAERDRNATLGSDAVLQQVIALLQQQKEIYESKIERLTQYIEEMEQEDIGNDVQSDHGTTQS